MSNFEREKCFVALQATEEWLRLLVSAHHHNPAEAAPRVDGALSQLASWFKKIEKLSLPEAHE